MLNRFLLLGESSVLLSVIKNKLSVERSNKGVFYSRDCLVVAVFSAFLTSIYFSQEPSSDIISTAGKHCMA